MTFPPQIPQYVGEGRVLQLEPGDRFYTGYHEWAVHQEEAAVILDRGYVEINGRKYIASQVGDVGGYPQIRVYGLPGAASDPQGPEL
jgi:hypothetical protein